MGGRSVNLGRQSLFESSPGLQSSRRKELWLIISAYAGFSWRSTIFRHPYLDKKKFCHSHGSEALEFLIWLCSCQIIHIHSGFNLLPRLGARSGTLRAHILTHKDEAERTN